MSSNNQFVVNYSLHQNRTDTTTLKNHLDDFYSLYQRNPDTLTADAGYGSEENYLLLDKRKIVGYVKHNQFDREQRSKEKDWFKSENLEHDKKKDILYCPIGEPMHNMGTSSRTTANGFKQTLTNYKATKCKRCPVRDVCHSQKGNRVVGINHRLRKLKEQANFRLKTEQGIKYRKTRPADIEPVFANVKHNKNFKRFMLRGIKRLK